MEDFPLWDEIIPSDPGQHAASVSLLRDQGDAKERGAGPAFPLDSAVWSSGEGGWGEAGVECRQSLSVFQFYYFIFPSMKWDSQHLYRSAGTGYWKALAR